MGNGALSDPARIGAAQPPQGQALPVGRHYGGVTALK